MARRWHGLVGSGGICNIPVAAALGEELTLSHVGLDNTSTMLYKLMFAEDLPPKAGPIGEPWRWTLDARQHFVTPLSLRPPCDSSPARFREASVSCQTP
jgi:hypothetical protein